MKFTVNIECDNDCFNDALEDSISQILANIIQKLQNGQIYGPCMDMNGNKVGTYELYYNIDDE